MTFCALTPPNPASTAASRPTVASLLLVALAVLLLTAAGLKGYSIATVPLEHREWLIAQVLFEWLMGVWLLSGIARRAAWMAALGLFSVFAAVAAHQALSRDVSCGCFGPVRLDPKYTLALDLTAVGLLLASGRSVRRAAPPLTAQTTLATAVLISGFGIVAAVGVRGLPRIERSVPVLPGAPGQTILLDPAGWIDQPLPLLPHLGDTARKLETGRWTILLYQGDCPRCAQRVRQGIDGDRAVIRVPPARPLPVQGAVTVDAALPETRRWRLIAPAVISTDNGVVTAVAEP